MRREITAQELGALLSGIDLSQAKRRKRYQRKSHRRRINIGDSASLCLDKEPFPVTLDQCPSIPKHFRRMRKP